MCDLIRAVTWLGWSGKTFLRKRCWDRNPKQNEEAMWRVFKTKRPTTAIAQRWEQGCPQREGPYGDWSTGNKAQSDERWCRGANRSWAIRACRQRTFAQITPVLFLFAKDSLSHISVTWTAECKHSFASCILLQREASFLYVARLCQNLLHAFLRIFAEKGEIVHREHDSINWSCFNQENPHGSVESISFLHTLQPFESSSWRTICFA